MSLLNKVTESISETKLGILSDWALRICLSWVFFEYGQPKFTKLMDSPDKPLSEEGRKLLQGLIDESYKQFTEAVADGRNLPVEEVRKFADGRIFTGTQAKELGLVDEVGDEFVARELAAEMVNIDPKIQPLTFGKKKKKILGLIPEVK